MSATDEARAAMHAAQRVRLSLLSRCEVLRQRIATLQAEADAAGEDMEFHRQRMEAAR